MTPERLQAMQRGREEARDRRRRQAIARVRNYRRWLHQGSRKGSMPAVPTDADYALAHAGGEPRSVWEATP